MLDSLAPARRRLVVGLVALLAVAAAVVATLVVVNREPDVVPVTQEQPGPVLLVPGYGGSTESLRPLAAALRAAGREARVVATPGDGTGDLRAQAERVDQVARELLSETGAPSVDVIGYSAGGVVVRWWVDQLGGDALARRVLTLSSPHHGTRLAALGAGFAPGACPVACQQMVPESDLLRTLNADDETPEGPLWVAMWTTDDQVVVPVESASLSGAVSFSVQSVCPGLEVAHGEMPGTAAVTAMVLAELGTDAPDVPDPSVCAA